MSESVKNPKNRIQYWALVVLANLIVLYLLLVPVDIFLPTGTAQQRNAQKIESDRQARDKIETVKLLSKGYKPMVYPDLFGNGMYEDFTALAKKYSVAPLAPQPNTNLIGCNEGYGFNSYKSDRFGFRNPDEIWDENKIDVLLIGDSFAHGACVPNEATIAGVLNNDGLKTINTGTGSNSPIHYASIVKTFVPKVKPTFAVVVFYANDNVPDEEKNIFYDLYFKSSPSLDSLYFDKSANQLTLSKKIKAFYEDLNPAVDKLTKSFLADETQQDKSLTDHLRAYYDSAKPHLKLSKIRMLSKSLLFTPHMLPVPFGTKLAINTLAEYCNTNTGCIPIIVYIPNSPIWRPDPSAENYKLSIRDYMKEKYPNSVAFLDSTSKIAAMGDSAYSPEGGHLSKEGYKSVSLMIYDEIKSHL